LIFTQFLAAAKTTEMMLVQTIYEQNLDKFYQLVPLVCRVMKLAGNKQLMNLVFSMLDISTVRSLTRSTFCVMGC
jgi:hypothetical protein